MLIAIRDESPLVCRVPDVSEHSHFGTCHIRTSTIQDCTSALFQVTMYRQFTRKVGTSGSNSLLFTPFTTVSLDSRPRVNKRLVTTKCKTKYQNKQTSSSRFASVAYISATELSNGMRIQRPQRTNMANCGHTIQGHGSYASNDSLN